MFPIFMLLPLAAGGLGCGAAANRQAPTLTAARPEAALDPAERAAKIARWRAWEPKSLAKHRIDLADAGMSAELESASAPKVECQKLASGGMLCGAQIDLGTDDEGERKELTCSVLVDKTPLPFGVFFKRTLAGRTIEEVPKLEVEPTPNGAAARIVVPSNLDEEERTVFGTTKIAVAYGSGYSLACEDNNAGASAAFERISSAFFASASFRKPVTTALLRTAFRHRRGDALRGFSVASIVKEDEGYSETYSSFYFETDGKTWHVMDMQKLVERDAKGAVDSIRTVHWREGGSPAVLSAKPGESGKMRLKLEDGQKSESLEITPLAPLSTELWEAPALLRVSSGAAQAHRYGFLSVNADGEPTIAYSALSRAKSGVLVEEVDHGGKKKNTGASPESIEKNEISIDERGFSTKQVSADTIYERIFLEGDLPARNAAKARSGRRAP
jgi:hypothetical protein